MQHSGDEEEPVDLDREIQAALSGQSVFDLAEGDVLATSRPLPGLPKGATPKAGAFLEGIVAGVGKDDVFVEFGPRQQGVVPRSHFAAPPEPGAAIRVFVQEYAKEDGLWLCSVQRTVETARWEAVAVGSLLQGVVRAANSGGLELQCGTLTAFLPASHVALERIDDLASQIGRSFEVEVIDCDPAKRRLVVSRRGVLSRERDAQRASAVGTLSPGQTLRGTVTRIEPFGAFVELGGVEGLLHVSELAWTRVEKPEEHVAVGDVIEVQVLRIEEDDRRISLSRKVLQQDPYQAFVLAHPVGARVEGKVTRVAPYGAFIEVAAGVEGLAHVSQLAPGGVQSVKEVCRRGDTVKARVVSVEPERRRLGLSLLTDRGDRLTDDVADDETVRRILREGSRGTTPEPTLGDILRKALEGRKQG